MVSPRIVLLGLHVFATIITVGAVAVTDGLTMFVKLKPKAMKVVVFFSPFLSLVVWTGFFLLAVTGTLLLLLHPADVTAPLFQLKMAFVGLVFVNGIVLNRYIEPQFETYVEQGRYQLPATFERIAMLSGLVSVTGWWGATFTAYFLVGGPP
jgi:hypothetical protein